MNKSWWFLIIVAFIYLIMLFLSPTVTLLSLQKSINLIWKIIPALVFVFIIMLLTNLFITQEKVKKYLAKGSGFKKWLASILGGVISMGPIYAWYPFLKDFHKKGASHGFLAAFLYARSVKPFLIPVMVVYFGLLYTALFVLVLLISAFVQGLLFERIDRWL